MTICKPSIERWPAGCHSPNSCDRNQICMYANCRYEHQDIKSDIATAKAALTAPALTSTSRHSAWIDAASLQAAREVIAINKTWPYARKISSIQVIIAREMMRATLALTAEGRSSD